MTSLSKGVGSAPWAPPHAYDKQEVQNPRPTAVQQSANAKGCVYECQKLIKLHNGWVFGVSMWNADLLTGTAGEMVKYWMIERLMLLVYRRRDGWDRVVRFGVVKGISSFVMDVRRKLKV